MVQSPIEYHPRTPKENMIDPTVSKSSKKYHRFSALCSQCGSPTQQLTVGISDIAGAISNDSSNFTSGEVASDKLSINLRRSLITVGDRVAGEECFA